MKNDEKEFDVMKAYLEKLVSQVTDDARSELPQPLQRLTPKALVFMLSAQINLIHFSEDHADNGIIRLAENDVVRVEFDETQYPYSKKERKRGDRVTIFVMPDKIEEKKRNQVSLEILQESKDREFNRHLSMILWHLNVAPLAECLTIAKEHGPRDETQRAAYIAEIEKVIQDATSEG